MEMGIYTEEKKIGIVEGKDVIPADSLLQFDIIILTISIDIRSNKMYKRISALKARQNLGQVMNEVALKEMIISLSEPEKLLWQ